jgi:hypothetical protein
MNQRHPTVLPPPFLSDARHYSLSSQPSKSQPTLGSTPSYFRLCTQLHKLLSILTHLRAYPAFPNVKDTPLS